MMTWSHSRPLMRWMVERSTDGPSPAVRPEHLAQPRLEAGHVGMQRGHRLQRRQVVGMGGAVGLAARRVEHVHGLAEARLRHGWP